VFGLRTQSSATSMYRRLEQQLEFLLGGLDCFALGLRSLRLRLLGGLMLIALSLGTLSV